MRPAGKADFTVRATAASQYLHQDDGVRPSERLSEHHCPDVDFRSQNDFKGETKQPHPTLMKTYDAESSAIADLSTVIIGDDISLDVSVIKHAAATSCADKGGCRTKWQAGSASPTLVMADDSTDDSSRNAAGDTASTYGAQSSLLPYTMVLAHLWGQGGLFGSIRRSNHGDGVGKALLALRNAHSCVEKLPGGHLRLCREDKTPLNWPCAASNVLYVRSCFAPLYEKVLSRCAPDPILQAQKHLVTGQPGIGKSVFGCVQGLLCTASTFAVAWTHMPVSAPLGGTCSFALCPRTLRERSFTRP